MRDAGRGTRDAGCSSRALLSCHPEERSDERSALTVSLPRSIQDRGRGENADCEMSQKTTKSGNVFFKGSLSLFCQRNQRPSTRCAGRMLKSCEEQIPRRCACASLLGMTSVRPAPRAPQPAPRSHCLTADNEWLSPRRWRAQRSTSARRSAVGRSAVAGGAVQSSLDHERIRTTPRAVGRSMRSSISGSPWPPPTSSCRVSPEDPSCRSSGVTSPAGGRRPSRRRATPGRAVRTCTMTTRPASTDRLARRG